MALSTETRRQLQLAGCVVGIYTCYLLYGYVQEALYKPRVNPDGSTAKFHYTLLLLFCQCVAGSVFAAAAQVVVGFSQPRVTGKRHPVAATLLDGRASELLTKPDFTLCAFLYLAAMGCSNEALRYVSYPFQALAKSCKMIPVMIFRVVLLRVRYPWYKYLCVVAMTAGVAMFQLTRVKTHSEGPSTEIYGVLLLMGSLSLDGLTGPIQERTNKKYPCSNLSFMLLNNLHAGVVVGVPLLLSNQLIEGVQFCMAHPDVQRQLLMFALLSAAGQLFIFYCILNFDALVCVTVTTTRKLATIALSVWAHNNSLTPHQWLSVLLVFGAIVFDIVMKRRSVLDAPPVKVIDEEAPATPRKSAVVPKARPRPRLQHRPTGSVPAGSDA